VSSINCAGLISLALACKSARLYFVAAALIVFTLFPFGHSKERINMIYPSIGSLVLGLLVAKDTGLYGISHKENHAP
jgi:hypothetical protein